MNCPNLVTAELENKKINTRLRQEALEKREKKIKKQLNYSITFRREHNLTFVNLELRCTCPLCLSTYCLTAAFHQVNWLLTQSQSWIGNICKSTKTFSGLVAVCWWQKNKQTKKQTLSSTNCGKLICAHEMLKVTHTTASSGMCYHHCMYFPVKSTATNINSLMYIHLWQF